MKRLILAVIGFTLLSCHKEDLSIPPGLIKGNLVLSEVWIDGLLAQKNDYSNGKMTKLIRVKYAFTFDHVNEYVINFKGVYPEGFAMYGMENNLNHVHYLTEQYFPKDDQLTWEQGKLVAYMSTRSSRLSSLDEVTTDSIRYNGDREVEIRSYFARYVHNELRNQVLTGTRLFRWHSPLILREIAGENKYTETRFSGFILRPDYNIVNFPWLTNKIGVSNTDNLMNMLVSGGFGQIAVGSRMLTLEVREVTNGSSMVVSRVENLRTNKDRLPVSYDIRSMASGKLTHYEFKYLTL